jgi:Glycosyltransferase family 87
MESRPSAPVEPSARAADREIVRPSQPHTPERATDVAAAVRRVGALVALGLVPLAAVVAMVVLASHDGSLAADFRHELYPEAKLLLHGTNPFPSPTWDPTAQPNLIWPPVAAYLVSPLTLLPAGAANVVMALLGLACFALALWLVGARDWRVYGVVALWPEVVGETRVSHLTPLVALLIAGAWRLRDVRGAPGALVGVAVAVKFFVWPVGLWLAATRRARETLVAALVAGSSLLLVLPFTGLDDYVRSLARLGRAFDQDSYTVYGLLVQAGASDSVARAATLAVGATLLAATWRYQSFALAVAAALVLSPIVWLDYFALAALPLALARPRLSPIWFVPLATWGLKGAGLGIGDTADITRLLVVFALVFAVAFSHDRSAWRARQVEARPERAPHARPSIGRSSTV